ncbi:phage minor tail protein G [Escherichia coli]|nr:phage minor tail protein G [Escherichia coli]
MFLKQGTFNYEKQSVVLSELSGLQRIEYLAFVQQRTAKFDAGEGELPEAERQIAFLRMGMDINAWLVSRSLWNADQSKDVETLCASVITTWSYDALGAGAEMVLSLSGILRMGMDINAWLVSRSLWNAEQSQDVETLCASVITTWSYDALGTGAEMVLSLSGMGAIENAGDLEHEVLTPEKS